MNIRRRELLIATGLALLVPLAGRAEPSAPRRLDLKNANTGESFSGPYRDADGPIAAALADLAIFLRDHHANKVGPVSVPTLDILADVMDQIGQTRGTILSAFRTPETNAMLRARYFGVAEKSQHLLGKALDVTFDARLGDAEKAALAMQRGGVGWYPNSHFVHLDSGPVRHWEYEWVGLDGMLLAPLHHVPSLKEMMARYRAYARHEFLLRHGK